MAKKKKNFTPISKHSHEKGMLKTKLSQLNMQMIDWERDLMPEHLWIELLSDEYKDINWFKIYEDFLDKLDECLETQPKTPILGLISDFSVPSEIERKRFIDKHKEFIYRAFFKPIGKILTLYPDNPAAWLILDEWKNLDKVDFVVELQKVGRSLERLIKGKDLYAGNIRAIPLGRMFKHNKLFLSPAVGKELTVLLPKYPGQCTEDEKYQVQQFARTSMNMTFMTEERYVALQWPKYFWRHNYDLVPCSPVHESLDKGDNLSQTQVMDLQKKLWANSIRLIKYLDKISAQYKYDLYDPGIDEIKLGLFSRVVRLYISFVSNPYFWNRDLSGILLRCLGETEIIFAYLVGKGTEEDYKKFKEYARGKEKLLMLHLQDNLKATTSIEGKTVEGMAEGIGGGFLAEISDIDLKGWTKKTVREMAKEVKLDELYRWVIDPSSAELHGSWTSIRGSNLVVCSQIMHRFHMVPKYYEPPIYLSSLFIAKQSYLYCQEYAINMLHFPKPDEALEEISEISDAYKKRMSEVKTEQNSG